MVECALNVVNCAASIAALISFVVAVCTWRGGLNRIMDGFLNVGTVATHESGSRVVRFQNVGGSGVLIQSVWINGFKYDAGKTGDTNLPSNVLMPGEYFFLTVHDSTSAVVFYTTHLDVTVRHVDRFVYDWRVMPDRAINYVKPDRKTRKTMEYKAGALFDIGCDDPQRRTIPFCQRPQIGSALDRAIQWLDDNGYHAIRGGIS